MSQTLPGSPEPGLEGEEADFIKFAEGMTEQRIKDLAKALVEMYRNGAEDVDTEGRT